MDVPRWAGRTRPLVLPIAPRAGQWSVVAEAAVIGAVWGALATMPARARHEVHHAAVALSLISAGYFVALCHRFHHRP